MVILYVQDAAEGSTENWGVLTMTQWNKNSIHEHGPKDALVMN
jgi:hypothetical protein